MEEKLYQLYENVSDYMSGNDTYTEDELLSKAHELANDAQEPLRDVLMGDDIEDICGFLGEHFCD